MSADTLLSRLDGAKQTGSGRWIAKCPAHDDRKASLSVREIDDGRTLLHCFAGCHVEEILSAVSLTFSDLFPERALDHHKPRERRPFNAIDVLRCVGFEALVAQCAASHMAQGNPLSETDKERLLLAASRLQRAVEVASGN